jgi:DNA-binding response OmpR family regulator
VLVVDDDADLRAVLGAVLGRAGLDVVTAADGRAALRRLYEDRPDGIVLDVGLPDLDGFELLRRVRDMSDVPVIMLTARGLERDKIEGLRTGADDYVTKPFSNAELVARVQAALRRASGPAVLEVLADGLLEIDLRAKSIHLDGEEIQVSPTEWHLLVTFLRHPGQVLSAAQLLEHAWADPTGIGPERVKFAVLRLRRRLGWQDPQTSPIEAVRGFGYRYRGMDATPPPDRSSASSP